MCPSAVTATCPSQEELARFCRGELPNPRLDDLAAHLDSCSHCQSLLPSVGDTGDDLLSELRQISTLGAAQDQTFGKEIADIESFSVDLLGEALERQASGAPGDYVPQRLGEYVLLNQIGSGGMGTVYRAIHSRLQKVVALKVLSPRRLNEARAKARFEREMRAVGQLSHPNIVTATDAGEIENVSFLVMEFVEGTDLARLIKRHGRLPCAEACELVRQAALGLHYAHSHGMVHRDVKPSNLLLSAAPEQPTHGLVKVVDLGLTLLHDADAGIPANSSSKLIIGSLDYMAPEQASDAHEIDHRADLYSLGCTLFELLSGKPPFFDPGHPGRLHKIKAHASFPVPKLAAACPAAPAGLANIVERLLAKEPLHRYSNAAELATALQPFCGGANLARLLGPEGFGTTPATSLPPRRRRIAAAALGGLAALLLASVIYVQTDRGTVEIASDDDDIEVRVEQNGNLVTILDRKQNKQVQLRSGVYDARLARPDEDLSLDASGFTMSRGGKEIVRVRRQPPPTLHSPFDAEEAKRQQLRWARYLETTPQIKDGLGIELALIPPGEFLMASGYHVKLGKPFLLATHELTVGEFRRFVEATGYKSELEASGRGAMVHDTEGNIAEKAGVSWRNVHPEGTDDIPVTAITYTDAERFCAWLSEREKKTYRLPTEAEWAWACRAGSQTDFPWGNDEKTVDDFDWHRGNSGRKPQPVGRLKPNAWGLFDINGNAAEWCRDWHLNDLPQAVVADPAGPPLATCRVLRGGSFIDGPWHSTSRGAYEPSKAMIHFGFRVYREF